MESATTQNGAPITYDQPSFDQVKQRIQLVIETSVVKPTEAFSNYLGAIWQIKERARGGTMMRVYATAPVRDGLYAQAKVQLWLDPLLGGFAVRADVQMNGHDIVRQRYGIDASIKGAGGATNFALPSAEYTPDDLQLQLDALVEIPMAIVAAIVASIPDAIVRDGRSKIVAGEVCLDVPCDDPQLALRKDRITPRAGTTTVTHTTFASSTESGRKLCNKERTHSHGPESIAYEKWRKHVRVEERAHGVVAVVALLGSTVANEVPLTREDLYGLLVAFYNAAGEPCCDRKDHFVRASESQRTIVDLIVALLPLFRIAVRDPTEGGYRPRAEAGAIARRVLIDLLTSGIAHAVGVPKGTQVRQVLEELAAPGGPLVRGNQTTIFCLSSDYAYAARTAAE